MKSKTTVSKYVLYLLTVFCLCLLIFLKNTNSALYGIAFLAGLVVSIFLHELGHVLASKAVKVKVEGVKISLYGAVTHLHKNNLTPWKLIIIAMGGPLINLLIGLIVIWILSGNFSSNFQEVSRFNPFHIKTAGSLFFHIGLINIGLGLANLLPIPPFDGWLILKNLIRNVTNIRKYISMVVKVFCLMICVLALYQMHIIGFISGALLFLSSILVERYT